MPRSPNIRLKSPKFQGGGKFPYLESLAVVAQVHNRSTSISFSCNSARDGGNEVVAPGSDGIWFCYSGARYFDIIVEGEWSKRYEGRAYIKNGDVSSTVQSFSEFGGDYFSIDWDQEQPFDFKKPIEVYLLDS